MKSKFSFNLDCAFRKTSGRVMLAASNSSSGSTKGQQNDLDELVTAYTAPMPNQKLILTDFEAKKRKTKQAIKASGEADVSALEHYELEGPMIREFTIHIL